MIQFLLILFLISWSAMAQALPQADLKTQLESPAALSAFSESERKELAALYTARNFQPAWTLSDEASLNQTKAFLDSLAALVAYHGLSAEKYPIDQMRQMATRPDGDRQQLELMITDSLLRLAHDLRGDNADLGDIYMGWHFRRADADVPTLVRTAIEGGTLGGFFGSVGPASSAYRNLAQALQRYTKIDAQGGWPVIASGPVLSSGAQNERVAQLRTRLSAEGYLTTTSATPDLFDDEVHNALVSYQKHNGLDISGRTDAATLGALNVPVSARILQIRANLERWRHMPDDYQPDRSVLINIPDYSLTISENGQPVYNDIVVLGRTDRPTPFIDSAVENMVINPSWHVPADLAQKDILPKLRRNPHYLEKLDMVIDGRSDDPYGLNIDWHSIKHISYQLRQNPGHANSLGQVKFNFDSPFDVYMHGTPHKELFSRTDRAFSSGCIRLKKPEKVAEVIFSPENAEATWDADRIEKEIATGHSRTVSLKHPMPIYVMYWTAFAGDDGQLNFRKDVYGYDAKLNRLLHFDKAAPKAVADDNKPPAAKG
jgi:murein L,D-transpeptidase YcbB/YkuD